MVPTPLSPTLGRSVPVSAIHVLRTAVLLCGVLLLGACASTTTQMGGVSRESIQAEQLTQQRYAMQSAIKSQARLETVALPLLHAALPLCREHVTLRSGVNMANLESYGKEWRDAARAEGFSDTLTITSVVKGSGADRAGLRAGDRILSMGGEPVKPGKSGLNDFGRRLSQRFALTESSAKSRRDAAISDPSTLEFSSTSAPMTIRRDTTTMEVDVPADTVCAFGVEVVKDDQLNAFADGTRVYVTSAMMRFASDDDLLAVVVSHEIGHNAMGHMAAKKRNSMIGAFFGAVMDVAMASQGVNTGGAYTNQMAGLGAMTFSQDFEREADYTGLALLARSGRPMSSASALWRQMAAESPGSIKFASSHPTTAERFVRLEEWTKEFAAKQAAGEPVLPTMKPNE